MDIQTLADLPAWDWPDDAALIIRNVLEDADAPPEQRELAAELAGDSMVMSDEMAEFLMAMASDQNESPDLRAMAAVSLGPALEDEPLDDEDEEDDVLDSADDEGEQRPAFFDDAPLVDGETRRRIEEFLAQTYRDAAAPKVLRRLALEASVRKPQDWHRQAVAEAFEGQDPEWRLTGVFCMQYIKGMEEHILRATTDHDPKVKRFAIQAAGNAELSQAWPAVRAILTGDGQDRDLLFAAIEAAAWVGPDEATLLLDQLASSDDEDIAEAATDAMMMAELEGEEEPEQDF